MIFVCVFLAVLPYCVENSGNRKRVTRIEAEEFVHWRPNEKRRLCAKWLQWLHASESYLVEIILDVLLRYSTSSLLCTHISDVI